MALKFNSYRYYQRHFTFLYSYCNNKCIKHLLHWKIAHIWLTTHLHHVIKLVALFVEGGGTDLPRLIQKVYREELAFTPRVGPSADAGLVGHSGTNSPSIADGD